MNRKTRTLHIPDAPRALGGVLGKLVQFSSGFMADGRGDVRDDARPDLEAERPSGAAQSAAAPAAPAVARPDWQDVVGVLKDSPTWNGDPLAVQEAMRKEWD